MGLSRQFSIRVTIPKKGDFADEVPSSQFRRTASDRPHKHKGHDLFRVRDLSACSSRNCSVWAKGDLNPHVPKDTGT